jgi:hypothetical protein
MDVATFQRMKALPSMQLWDAIFAFMDANCGKYALR